MDLSREHPFPGLRPFDFADHDFFFGREEQTYALYRLLNRSRFVAVVGSSGSGKSSLVRAGLLPLLQEENDDETGGASWIFATFHPGDAPLAALRDVVLSLATGADLETDILAKDVESALNASSFGLSKAIEEVPGLRGRNVLLVVDQFEELFRYAGRRDDAINFVQRLLEATRSHSSTIHVLITMRSDFIGDCAQFARLPEAVSAAQFLVPSLTRDQREQVIREPIEMAGGAIESLLVERLLNDSSAETDQLPVLQHCLSRLWERAPVIDGVRTLGMHEYEELGGIGQALSRHADEVMAQLGTALEPVVESVFRALSETDRDGRATRRAIGFAQLLAETGVSEGDLRRVLDRFRSDDCSFILPSTSSKPRLSDETRIDVVHEALLRRWTRISAPADLQSGQRDSGWLSAEAEDGWEYRALLNLVKSGSKSGNVTLPLDQVESRYRWWTSRKRTPAWAQRYGGDFNLVEKLFADSLAALEEHREQERRALAAAAEEQGRAEQRRRDEERRNIQEEFARARARRTRNAAIAMAALAVIALVCAGWAFTTKAAIAAKDRALANAYAQIKADDALKGSLIGQKNGLIGQKNGLIDKENVLIAQERSNIKRQTALIARNNRLQAALNVQNAALSRSNEQLGLLNGLREAERVTYHGAELAMLKDYLNQHPRDAGAHLDLGDLYEGMNENSDAASQYRAAIASDARYAYAYASLCQAESMQDHDKAALADCTKAIKMDPHMSYAYRQRGLVKTDLNDYTGAIADLTRAVQIDPKEAHNSADLCVAQFEARLYDSAIKACDAALSVDRTLNVANYWRARAEFRQARWTAAIDDFTLRIVGDPQNYSSYYWRGRARVGRAEAGRDATQGADLDGAIADMSEVLSDDPQEYSGDAGGSDAHYWRGVAEYDAENYNNARSDMTLALAKGPTDVAAHYWRGKSELGLRNWNAAIADLLRAGDYQIATYWLAVAYCYAADYRHAREQIGRYIAKHGDDGYGYYWLARIELDAGDPDQARESATKAETVYTSASDKANMQAFLTEMARIQSAGLMPRLASDGRSLLASSNDAAAFTDRGDIYESVGDHTWAIDDYSAAIAVDPRNAYAYASRCQSRFENASNSADLKEAKSDCDTALEIDPKLAYAFRERAYVDLSLLDLEDLTAANTDANRAVTLDPAVLNLLMRCRLYVFTERYTEAINDCSTAVKLDPGHSIIYYWRAKARLGAADYVDGIADIQAYLKANAEDGDAYLLQAQLELGLGNHEFARTAANKALHYYQISKDQKGIDNAQKFLNDLVAVTPSR